MKRITVRSCFLNPMVDDTNLVFCILNSTCQDVLHRQARNVISENTVQVKYQQQAAKNQQAQEATTQALLRV